MKFKNFGKIACMGAVVAVAGTFGLTGIDTKNATVMADTAPASHIGDTLSITSYKTNYEASEIKSNDTTSHVHYGKKYIVLPTAVAGSGTVNVTATNSVGKAVETYKEGSEWRLNLSSDKGVYYVTYSVEKGGVITATKELKIAIDTIVPSFDWDENSKQILPSKVNAGSTLVLPYPSLINESAEKEDEDDVIFVQSGTSDLTADYFANLDDAATKAAGLTVTLTDPQKQEIALSKNSDGYYKVNIANSFKTGKYTLTYTFTSSNTYTIKKTFNFEVVTTDYFDQTKDVDLKISALSSAMPTSMELNVETQLPYPTVINTVTGEEVAVYTEITVTCTPSNGGAKITWNSDERPDLFKDFKFKPTVAGNYNISYKVSDLGGVNTATAEYKTIKNVKKGTTGSQVFVVEEYTTNLDDVKNLISEEIEDAFKAGTLATADYAIPTKIATGTTVKFPAIYGVDLTDDYDDLTFSRVITNKTTGTSYTYTANSSDQERRVEADKSFEFEFTEAGTYTVRYQMRDSTSTNSSIYYDPFTITVEDNYEDAEAPEATLLNVSKTVVAGEKTTFSVQAVDFVSDEADTIADANLKLVVEYKYDDGNWTSLLAKNGVYTIEVPKAQTGNITVKATATDDAGNSFTTPEKVIEIKNYTADDDTPTSTAFDFDSNWFESGSTFKTFVKGDEVKLPTVSFNDTTSDNLVVTAYVDHINSTTNRTTNIAIFNGLSGSSKTVSLGGETVKLPYSGSYVVTYIATDPAGNMQVSSFEFEAISNTAPTIAGLGNIEGTAEWGEEIDLVSPITVYNDTEIVDYNIVYVPNNITDADDYVKNTVANGSLVIKVEGSYIALPDNKIQAREGTITVSYWAKGDTGLCSEKQTKTITASDSKAPTIYVDESLLPDTHEFDADADNEAETTNWIYIPSIENVIDEGSGIDYSSLEVTAQYTSSSQKLEIKDIPADDAEHAGFYGYVVATKNGTINITYKITDNRGNESQATMLAVAVGDVTAPTISIDDVELKAAYKVGDTITINLSDVKVSDDSDVVDDPETTDEDESADNVKSGDVVVTLTCNGSTVAKSDSSASGSTYVFNIEKAGNYVVTYKITDAAGNTATKTMEFTVSEPASSPVISTAVWGTVLIIASLLVLGGVIYFFIKPSKTKVKDVKSSRAIKVEDSEE